MIMDSSDYQEMTMQQYALYGYATLCIIGFVFGAANGGGNWVKWFEKRSPITLLTSSDYINSLVDPIVNVGRDMGYLAWHTVTSGLLSGVIVGTFPVSVPLLAFFSKEKTD